MHSQNYQPNKKAQGTGNLRLDQELGRADSRLSDNAKKVPTLPLTIQNKSGVSDLSSASQAVKKQKEKGAKHPVPMEPYQNSVSDKSGILGRNSATPPPNVDETKLVRDDKSLPNKSKAQSEASQKSISAASIPASQKSYIKYNEHQAPLKVLPSKPEHQQSQQQTQPAEQDKAQRSFKRK